jgi:hypothetical protein
MNAQAIALIRSTLIVTPDPRPIWQSTCQTQPVMSRGQRASGVKCPLLLDLSASHDRVPSVRRAMRPAAAQQKLPIENVA